MSEKTFAETIAQFFGGVNKNIAQADILLTGPKVRVKYVKSKPSIYEELFGEKEFNAFRISLYFLLFALVFFALFGLFLYYLAPALFSFQSKDVNIVLKIILLLSAIASPFGLYPFIVSMLGPYHIYSSYLTAYHTSIFYLLNTVISYHKIDITDATNIVKKEINMGNIFGVIFLLGISLAVFRLTRETLRTIYPSLIENMSGAKKKEKIVSKKYYEDNKDKDLY